MGYSSGLGLAGLRSLRYACTQNTNSNCLRRFSGQISHQGFTIGGVTWTQPSAGHFNENNVKQEKRSSAFFFFGIRWRVFRNT